MPKKPLYWKDVAQVYYTEYVAEHRRLGLEIEEKWDDLDENEQKAIMAGVARSVTAYEEGRT